MNVSVLHEKNAGVSAARNKGIEYFINCNENELLCFLDADDLWKEGVFEKSLLTELKEKVDVEVFVFGGVNCTEDISRFSNPYQYKPEIINGGDGAIWRLQRHFCANLYRLKLFKKWNIRFQDGLKYSEDKIFMMQCAFLSEKIKFMPQILHIYRMHIKSAMSIYQNLSPMDYYMPIINGWIASDLFLNSKMSISKKSTDAGFVLAGIYFGDMAKEHCMRGHSLYELDMKNHKYYYLFENMNANCVSKKQFADYNLLINYPKLFSIKYRIVGIIDWSVRILLKLKPINNFRIKRKFPLIDFR